MHLILWVFESEYQIDWLSSWNAEIKNIQKLISNFIGNKTEK